MAYLYLHIITVAEAYYLNFNFMCNLNHIIMILKLLCCVDASIRKQMSFTDTVRSYMHMYVFGWINSLHIHIISLKIFCTKICTA